MGTKKNNEDYLLEPGRSCAEVCCINPDCEDAGIKGKGNIILRKGKGSRWSILLCKTCDHEFSERAGTPLWNTRLDPKKAAEIAKHLKEGCGIRQTARLVGVNKDTVTAYAARFGLHAYRLHDRKAKDLEVKEVQFDEKWSFVEKKRKEV